MRYQTVDTVSFTDSTGKTVNIKDMREYDDFLNFTFVNVNNSKFIDEIVSRKNVYGNNSESEI